MGSAEVFPFEGPVHQVSIRKPFYIGEYEVTYDEWDACVMDRGCTYRPDDAGAGRGRRPVTDVDWNDAKIYAAWLSQKTGKTYRLPTESEWEYAARGATSSTYSWGRSVDKDRANCAGCTSEPHKGTIRSDHSSQMRSVFMTWPAMPQSGSRIARPRAIEGRPLMDPLQSNPVVPSGCFGRLRSTMTRNICAQPHGSVRFQRLLSGKWISSRSREGRRLGRRSACRSPASTASAQAPLTCDSDQH